MCSVVNVKPATESFLIIAKDYVTCTAVCGQKHSVCWHRLHHKPTSHGVDWDASIMVTVHGNSLSCLVNLLGPLCVQSIAEETLLCYAWLYFCSSLVKSKHLEQFLAPRGCWRNEQVSKSPQSVSAPFSISIRLEDSIPALPLVPFSAVIHFMLPVL